MRKIWSLCVAVAILAAAAVPYRGIARAQTADPPHILFIMSDDHAWPLYNFMYDKGYKYIDESEAPDPDDRENLRPISFPDLFRTGVVKIPAGPMTPNLDRLARRGVIFPHGYSADSVCVPSFATTQTGLNRKDNGVLKASEFPKNAGGIGDYISHITYPNRPSYDSLAFGKSWKSYKPLGFTCAQAGADPKCVAEKKGHFRFQGLLDQIVGSLKKDTQQRWFAWYSPHLPHADFDGRTLVDSGVEQCGGAQADDRSLELPTKYFEEGTLCQRLLDMQARMASIEECFGSAALYCDPGNPEGHVIPNECDAWGTSACEPGYRYLRFKKIYRDWVSTIMLEDFWIGLLLDFLENNAPVLKNSCGPGETCAENWACCLPGVAHNTLILYQTDNGMIPDEAVDVGVPSRGWKKSVGENGFRTPILVSLPSVFPGSDVDNDKNDLVHAIDLIPTMLDFATGLPVPTCEVGTPPRPPRWNPTPTPGWVSANPQVGNPPCLEGISLRPALASGSGDTPPEAKRKFLFAQKGSKVFVRDENGYRLFRKGCGSGKFQLYHVPSDLDENCDLLTKTCPGSSSAPSKDCICHMGQLLRQWYPTPDPCTALTELCQGANNPGCP